MTDDPFIGHTVDRRYTITDFVARGGSGTVYLARDNRLDRLVALKIMHNQLTHDPLFLERFKREAKSAAQLEDPHVVVLHDQGEDRGAGGEEIVYLTMEYLDGYSLRQVLRHHHALDVSSTLKIIIATLKGLSAAHEAHIIHRDVKPENVLIASNGRIKLGDFGLAKSVTSTTRTSILIGTIAYLAPETISAGVADERSDIYAVGVMLYEMLTGELPFPGDITHHIAYQHINNAPPLPSEKVSQLPTSLDKIISRAMDKDPQNRPESAGKLLYELELLQSSLDDDALAVHSPRMVKTPLKAKVSRNTNLPPDTFSPPSEQKTRVFTAEKAAEENEPAPAAHMHTQIIDGQDPADNKIISTLIDSGVVEIGRSDDMQDIDPQPTKRSKKNNGRSSQHAVPKYSLPRSTAKTIAWVFLSTLLTLLVAGGIWFFAAGPGATATIPETKGIDTEQAQKRLAESGFSNVSTEQIFDDDIDAGIALGTNPEAGAGKRKFALVTLQVSKGPQLFEVPSLATLDVAAARRVISEAGFSVGSVTEEWNETIPAGQVIGHRPEAGQEIRKNSAIDLTVSKGKQPIPVPQVIGLSEEEATETLTKAGFTVETNSERSHHRTIPEGHVVSQNPANGTLTRGATVVIQLSKGPRIIKVPDVRRMNVKEATEKLEELGFVVKYNNILGGILGLVQGQSPEKRELPEGSTITLNIV